MPLDLSRRAPHAPPRLIQLYRHDGAAARAELLAGLASVPAVISPKHFYDPLGSRLFAAITELPEYYLTRAEAAILRDSRAAILRALPAPSAGWTLVDLGAGNCEKAAALFDVLAPQAYVAVDISTDFLAESLDALHRRHPRLALYGVGLDFSQHLALPPEIPAGPRLVFYPGSSIGNFSPVEAHGLLQQARAMAGEEGALLIGVDLVKDQAVLEAAYDDALGVTAAFNLNVLNHVNRVLSADFDVADWQHVAFYAAEAQRIEMHLQARRAVSVRWPGGERRFAEGERIHTENSYKYTVEGFAALLAAAGWHLRERRTGDGQFGVFIASARG